MSALKTDLSELIIAEGRYAVGGTLGTGSMGHVFRAFDTRLQTDVVIKVPTDRRLADPEFHKRFLQESRLLTQLNHPRIVKILDVGEHDGVPFFVMPYVDGGNLLERMRDASGKPRPLPPHSLKDWLRGVSEAIDFMHSRGYIHRDVKPANILFDAHGHVYLSDFGLSKILMDQEHECSGLTAANAVVGTPNYVAPELVLARKGYDGRVDQYSLAVTVYEVLTGKPPFEGGSPTATMVNHTYKHPPLLHEVRTDVSEALASAVRMAMSKRPWRRYESCMAFADAVLLSLAEPADFALTASSRSSSTGYSTVIERRPDVVVAGASRGANGVIPCPACREKLVLKAKYAGQRGRCVHCGARLQISRGLNQIRLLKPVSEANGKTEKPPSKTATIERAKAAPIPQPHDILGIRFTSRRSMWLTIAGLLLLLLGAVYVGRQSAQWNGDDNPAQSQVSNHSPE